MSDLPSFPLIEAVTGDPTALGPDDDVSKAVDAMGAAIPVVPGADWLALGLRFTTFEQVQSSVLVVARFGNELEFDLLGLSVLSFPAGDPDPLAYAELAVEASYKPSDGVLAIGGQLTPASYILRPECHLTGGFAAYSWTRDVAGGASAGDFVITAGGYHPAYDVPHWYPQVPRVGIDWQVDSNLTVKGQLYYALTPNALMAGGELDATWSSGNLSAWFTAYADFLLSWRPFYYRADAGISIGASYEVDLWFTSFTVTVHVGVDLEFHGPPFGGTAQVDLYICTITLHFGDESSAGPAPISWTEFKASVLPAPKPSPAATIQAAPAPGPAPTPTPTPTPTDTMCLTRVTGGLSATCSPARDGVDWVIDPEGIELTTVTAVPATAAGLVVDGGGRVELTPSGLPAFGVGPVAVADGNLRSDHEITITALGEERITEVPFDATAVLSNVPSTPWLEAVAMSNGDAATLNHHPAMLEGALTGFVLAPRVPAPDTTHSLDLSALQYDGNAPRTPPSRPPRAIPTSDAFDQSQAMTELETTIGAAVPSGARKSILATLRTCGLDVAADVDAGALEAGIAAGGRGAPVLSHLGEQPA